MNSLLFLAALAAAPTDALDWTLRTAPAPALDWTLGGAAAVSTPEPPPPAPAPRLKKLAEVDFSRRVFDEAGVPYSLAPWLEAMQTQGVPFFDPPRPLPAPTAGGDLSRQFGLPRWNGLIGGVDGVPNTGAAPRGTLLWCKQDVGNEAVYAICLSQGPENLVPRSSAGAPAQNYQPAYQPYYGQPYYGQGYGNCYGGVCLPSGR